MEDDEEQFDNYGGPRYRKPEEIEPSELREGLQQRQQAFHLGIVDGFAMQLETRLLKKQFDEEPIFDEAVFLNAISQMWIFAAYELMRTWRQRAGDLLKWAENGGLHVKLEQLRKETTFVHFGREIRARQIEEVISNPALVERLRSDLRRTHIPFARMEAIRVSIAKHEVRGRPKSVALMPTYGRINMWCGSLDYDLSNAAVSMGTISRRDIADEIRALPQMADLTDEEIKSFEEYMRGPSDQDLALLFSAAPAEDT